MTMLLYNNYKHNDQLYLKYNTVLQIIIYCTSVIIILTSVLCDMYYVICIMYFLHYTYHHSTIIKTLQQLNNGVNHKVE